MTTNVLIVLLFLLIALVSKSAALLLVVSRVTPVHRGRYASKARTLVYLCNEPVGKHLLFWNFAALFFSLCSRKSVKVQAVQNGCPKGGTGLPPVQSPFAPLKLTCDTEAPGFGSSCLPPNAPIGRGPF
jgi:hypothetical protein